MWLKLKIPLVSLNPIVEFLSAIDQIGTFNVDIGCEHTVLNVGVEEHTSDSHHDVWSKASNEEGFQLAIVVHTSSQYGVWFTFLYVLAQLCSQCVGWVFGWLHGVFAHRAGIWDVPGVAQLEVV